MSCLSDIFLALLLALLLGRAVRVEVVELAAGEHLVVGPMAVCFLGGSLNTLDASRWPVADAGRGRDASSLKQARGRGRLRSVVDEVWLYVFNFSPRVDVRGGRRSWKI